MIRQLFSARLFLAYLCLATMALLSFPTFADERILEFTSRITVEEDGWLTVEETIRARAEGNRIKRGIFRNIPLVIGGGSRELGNFRLLSTERDGRKEERKVTYQAGGALVNLRLGRADVILSTGVHTWVIRYRISHQVRHAGELDEIYWNITGNDWEFPIDYVRAIVTAPAAGPIKQFAGWTGQKGDKGEAWRAGSQDNQVAFDTTAPLPKGAGFTIAAGWPTGLVEASSLPPARAWQDPSAKQAYSPFILLISMAVVVAAFWFGPIRSLRKAKALLTAETRTSSQAPDNITPVMANWISDPRFRNELLTTYLFSLAERGAIHLNLADGELSAEKGDREPELHWVEKKLIARLFQHQDTPELGASNAPLIRDLLAIIHERMEWSGEKYVSANRLQRGLAIGLSVASALTWNLTGVAAVAAIVFMFLIVPFKSRWFTSLKDREKNPARIMKETGIPLVLLLCLVWLAAAASIFPAWVSVLQCISLLAIAGLNWFFWHDWETLNEAAKEDLQAMQRYRNWLAMPINRLPLSLEEGRIIFDRHIPWVHAFGLLAEQVDSDLPEDKSSRRDTWEPDPLRHIYDIPRSGHVPACIGAAGILEAAMTDACDGYYYSGGDYHVASSGSSGASGGFSGGGGGGGSSGGGGGGGGGGGW